MQVSREELESHEDLTETKFPKLAFTEEPAGCFNRAPLGTRPAPATWLISRPIEYFTGEAPAGQLMASEPSREKGSLGHV